jgi:hypothetical protein
MDILYKKVTCLNDEINYNISFIKQIMHIFDVNIFIVNNNEQKHYLELHNIHNHVFTGTFIMEKFFSMAQILDGEQKHKSKLVVVFEMTKELLNNRLLTKMIEQNKYCNITVMILSYTYDIIQTIRKTVDSLIFRNNDVIPNMYDKFFTIYPPFITFEENILALEKDEYVFYIKNSDRYIDAGERFKKLNLFLNKEHLLIDETKIIISVEI